MFDIMFDRKIFGSLRESSEHFRKCSESFVCLSDGQHWKSSIGGWNSSENRQKLRSWYVYKTNKIIHDARIFLLVFNSISQEFANCTREIWSLACEQAPEWGYASLASLAANASTWWRVQHLMTSAPLLHYSTTPLLHCVAGDIFVF